MFVRSGKTYDPVFVRLGAVTGDRTFVLDGVSADEQVVVSGALSLYAESQKKDRVPVETSPISTAVAESVQAEVESIREVQRKLRKRAQSRRPWAGVRKASYLQ